MKLGKLVWEDINIEWYLLWKSVYLNHFFIWLNLLMRLDAYFCDIFVFMGSLLMSAILPVLSFFSTKPNYLNIRFWFYFYSIRSLAGTSLAMGRRIFSLLMS